MPQTKRTRASGSSAAGKRRRPSRRKAPALAPTLGPLVCAFIERCLVHAEGDYFGQPFVLRPWQRAIIYRAYELEPDGARRYSRVLLGLPKGQGKTELAAAIAIAELAGPVAFAGWREDGQPLGAPRTSPDIPIAAASFEQADLLFGAARTMVRESPQRALFEAYDTEILLAGRPGKLYRVAAAAGTNDGKRPTFLGADELHEWTGGKERVHLVLSNGRAKRADAWELNISTAGYDLDTLLGRLYLHGKAVNAGDVIDRRFLMIWYEAPPEAPLETDAQLEAALRTANPALGDFLPLEALKARFREIPLYEFQRYHLNQWVSAPVEWLPRGAWEARAAPERARPAEQEAIVLGLEGDWQGQAVGLVACTTAKPRHLFAVDSWERPTPAPPAWRPPTNEEIKTRIVQTCAQWRCGAIAMNPSRWPELVAELLAAGLPVVAWNSHVTARIAPASKQLYEAVVVNGDVTHDGGAVLTRHVKQARLQVDGHGRSWIAKAPVAAAAVLAYDMAVRNEGAGPSVYETRGIRELG